MCANQEGSLRATAKPAHLPLEDGLSRQISYLRLSVTDRCDLRCDYCMPVRGVVFRPRADLLTFEEIERLVRLFTRHGVRRVRVTGGEPTVRAGIVDLIARLAAIREPADAGAAIEVLMTSNGHRLARLAPALARAGLSGVNISLDTVDASRFRALTSRGDLAAVVAGIEAAVGAGLRVKINAVAMRGVNENELGPLCELAWQRTATPRFIEYMPMSGGRLYSPEKEIPAREIRERLEQHFGATLEPVDAHPGCGPARYFRVGGSADREVGIISAMSEQFCATCNRVRLSAVGELHPCLGHDYAVSLRDLLRSGGTDGDLVAVIRAALQQKPRGHRFMITGAGGPAKHMVAIGG